jgi:hypothetical protein
MNPLQTMSFGAPLGWTQFHSRQSFMDNARLLSLGLSAISLLMNSTSSVVAILPLYLISSSMHGTYHSEQKNASRLSHYFRFGEDDTVSTEFGQDTRANPVRSPEPVLVGSNSGEVHAGRVPSGVCRCAATAAG